MLDLGEDRLDAFATLFVCRLADVIAAGFEVVATYRSPHVTKPAFRGRISIRRPIRRWSCPVG